MESSVSTSSKPRSICPICRSSYVQFSSLRGGCSIECRAEIKRQKERAKAAKLARRETRDKLVKLRTVRDWTKLAQAEFNKFIRLRDRNEPCISCGVFNPGDQYSGGAWDCGHFLSVGSSPELRFDERNAFKQCKSCNGGSGRFSRKSRTVSADYRERLVARVGAEVVEWLEGQHEPKRYRIDDLIAIRDKYRERVKEMKRNG